MSDIKLGILLWSQAASYAEMLDAAVLVDRLGYAHLWSNRAPVAAGIDTLDLSLTMRARYLGAALVVHDLTAPGTAAAFLPYSHNKGLPVDHICLRTWASISNNCEYSGDCF